MRHNDGFDSATSTLDGRPTQESIVAEMHTLLSAFERGIDGSGALIESQGVAGYRRELHAGCSNIRGGLNLLSAETFKLERAASKHTQRASRANGTKPSEDKVRGGLNPALWPKP